MAQFVELIGWKELKESLKEVLLLLYLDVFKTFEVIVLQFPRSDGNRDSLLLKKRHCSVSLAHAIIHYSVG